MVDRASTFLMFDGQAEEALRFYAELFETEPEDVKHFPQEAGRPPRLLSGALTIPGGLRLMLFDSPAKHAFGITPAISLFLDCDSVEEVTALAGELGEGGQVYMPLDSYPFAERFTWVGDRFGVTWQLSYVGDAAG